MDKDLDSLKSIYTYLTQRNGISPKIVVKLKTMNFCDKDTLDCLYYKTIPEIEKKKDNTCAVVTNEIIEKKGGKTNRRQKTNRRRLRKTQNKKRR